MITSQPAAATRAGIPRSRRNGGAVGRLRLGREDAQAVERLFRHRLILLAQHFGIDEAGRDDGAVRLLHKPQGDVVPLAVIGRAAIFIVADIITAYPFGAFAHRLDDLLQRLVALLLYRKSVV